MMKQRVFVAAMMLVAVHGTAFAVYEHDIWHEYAGYRYLLTSPQTWAEAEAEAVAAGGHLVTINDEDENDWLVTTFAAHIAHIGYYYDSEEWVWVSGEPVTYTNHDDAFPQGGTHAYIHLAHLFPGTWNANPAQTREPGIIEVGPVHTPPTANAGGPYTIFDGDMLTLDASGSTGGTYDIATYRWDLDNDGSFETDAADQAVLEAEYLHLESLGLGIGGPFDIHLQVTDTGGLTDTGDSTLTIMPVAPVADAGGPYVIDFGALLQLDASGSNGGSYEITSYRWDLDNDGAFETDVGGWEIFLATYEHLESVGLDIGGPYTVQLQVTDDGGLTDTAETTLKIVATPGDCDLDGDVDDDDLSTMLAHWNQYAGWRTGDFDLNGFVGDDDLSLLLANWTGGSAVPEPMTLAILALGVLVLRPRRR